MFSTDLSTRIDAGRAVVALRGELDQAENRLHTIKAAMVATAGH